VSSKSYPKPREAFSSKAALARDLVQKRKTEQAMMVLDRLALERHSNRRDLAKIASLVADSEVKRGRFVEAIAYYRRASSHFAVDDPRDWFRPRLGEIICLIKAVRADEALERSREAWEMALSAYAQFDELKKRADRRLRKGLSAEIPRRPIRPSVVGSKLGQAFLQEGEPDVATEFFRKAIEGNPKGGCRARQGLSAIALRTGDYFEAEKRALEALEVGKYQAKTVSAWGLLIEARQNRGKRGLDRDQISAIRKIENTDVRGRTVLQICKDLRSYGDPDWTKAAKLLPSDGVSDPSVYSLQIARLYLADARLSQNPRTVRRQAIVISRHPMAEAPDLIAALKAYATAAARTDKSLAPVWAGVRRLEKRWGSRQALKGLHSVGQAFVEGSDSDAAKMAFQTVLERSSNRSASWGRAVLSLSKVEEARGSHVEAASLLYQYFSNDWMPVRFRIQALLAWIEKSEELESVDRADILGAEKLLGILSMEVADFQTLLDIGRDLSLRGTRFRSLRDRVIRIGTERAEAAMSETENPVAYRKILLSLTRREFSDFRNSEAIIQRWELMDQRKRLWLWSESSDYWEYLSLILKSFVYQGRMSDADVFASTVLTDKAITEAGHAHVASAYAFSLIAQNRFRELVGLYRDFVQRHPTHRLAAQAYYWLFIEAKIRGANAQADSYVLSLRQCFGNKTHYRWEDQLLVRVELSGAGSTSAETLAFSGFSSDEIERERRSFANDLAKMGSHL